MTVTIGALPLRGESQEFEFTIADPGVVRAVSWTLEKRMIAMRGDAQFDEVLTMFIEFTPNATQRRRRFVVVATGQELGVKEGFVPVFVGSAISGNTGQVAHVYEVKAVS